MHNLHEDAVHHMPQQGMVRWSIDTTPKSVIISVEDEGPGIPADEMSHVTDRFFRGRHKSEIDSGLGISIVEVALRANNAEMILQNRTDRSGLRVRTVWRNPCSAHQVLPEYSLSASQAKLQSSQAL